MKVELQDAFLEKLNDQVDYIAKDKPGAARKFKRDILNLCKKISDNPLKYRPSIYFENKKIRDLIYKGYVVLYKVDESKNLVSVFAMIKHEEKLKDEPQ